jgi:cephalosporin hydroxylase
MSFDAEVAARIAANETNVALKADAKALMESSIRAGYSYNFSWLGRPIIQYPQDIVAMQEIIWRVQPDLIIETGIAHGGSLIFSAAMLELNAACGGPADATVLGIDIDIRAHNKQAIEAHPMSKRIAMIQGSSIAPDVVDRVRQASAGKSSVLVCLDSNHTHAHAVGPLRQSAVERRRQPEDSGSGILEEPQRFRDRLRNGSEAAAQRGPGRLSQASRIAEAAGSAPAALLLEHVERLGQAAGCHDRARSAPMGQLGDQLARHLDPRRRCRHAR